jgi:hypothetical protein
LKENVIIGKLIPAGTGFVPGRFTEGEIEEILEGEDIVTEEVLSEEALAEALSDDGAGVPPPVAAD